MSRKAQRTGKTDKSTVWNTSSNENKITEGIREQQRNYSVDIDNSRAERAKQ